MEAGESTLPRVNPPSGTTFTPITPLSEDKVYEVMRDIYYNFRSLPADSDLTVIASRGAIPITQAAVSLRYVELSSVYLGSDGKYYVGTKSALYVPSRSQYENKYNGIYKELDPTLAAPGTNPYTIKDRKEGLKTIIGSTFVVYLEDFIRFRLATPEEIERSLNYRANAIDRFGFSLNSDGTLSAPNECFPASTLILTGEGKAKPIRDICTGDTVLAFDSTFDLGRANLVVRSVKKIFRSCTTEWVQMAWVEGGVSKSLVVTPGHRFLNRYGEFQSIGEMIAAGRAEVVLASGELAEVTAERIVYSAETADMFERAVAYVDAGDGTAAKPTKLDGWQTYNFEVEELHTYVAGGVRVHNDSWFQAVVNTGIFAELPIEAQRAMTLAAINAGYTEGWSGISSGAMAYGAVPDFNLDGIPESWIPLNALPYAFADFIGLDGTPLRLDGRFSPQYQEALFADSIRNIYFSHPTGDHGAWQPYVDTAHRQFVNETLAGMGGWTPPDGYTIVPNGGGFSIVKVGGDNRPTGEHLNPNANGTENGGSNHQSFGGALGEAFGAVAEAIGNVVEAIGNAISGFFDAISSAFGGKPILLDLDNDGIEITQLTQSTRFIQGEDGLSHRTAWAGAGDGVLFIDLDGDGQIGDDREYVFTEWDPTADSDMEALRLAFDTNGDGKLTSADARWGDFRVLVTKADGSTETKTLAALGITEIGLAPDTTQIVLADGSRIDGQASFTMGGTSRTVANVTLAAERRVVETVSTDGSGTRTVTATGYGTGGEKVFVVKSVTNAAGTQITNTWDDNADGVVDRHQTIATVTDGSGNRIETVENRLGADTVSGVERDRTVTTTSADGQTVEILRDSRWGGWFDQREYREVTGGGGRNVTIQELAPNGAVITVSKQGVSANGNSSVLYENLDGIGGSGSSGAERVTTRTIATSSGVRTETTVVTNRDGSLIGADTLTISADGLDRTTVQDLNGDTVIDRRLIEETTQTSGGGTTAEVWLRNGDNSLVSWQSSSVSADGLTRTVATDADGDGDIDRTVTEVVVIDGSGNRTTTTTARNTDNSIFSLTKTVLAANQITSETWVDQNQDGTLQSTDLVRSVILDSGTQNRITTTWVRNPDGSYSAQTVETTSASGLTRSVTIDADGDGDIDQRLSDVTVLNGDQTSTRTIEVRNNDNSLVTRETITTSANGLTTTTLRDLNGDGTTDGKTVETVSQGVGGDITLVMSDYAGNGTTLLSRLTVEESADRRTRTETLDRDGDGVADSIVTSVMASDGSVTMTTIDQHANLDLAARTVQAISANRLSVTTTTDSNGDGIDDTATTDATAIGADGVRTRTVEVRNGDASLRMAEVTLTSDDGLATIASRDRDGDGIVDQVVSSSTTIATNGTRTTLEQVRSGDDTLLSQVETSISDDGLTIVRRSDADGDGDFDLSRTTVTVLQNNGGQVTTEELRDLANVLREKRVTTVSDDGRNIAIQEDLNGDGAFDRLTTRVIANDGTLTEAVVDYSATGLVIARSRTVASDDRLVVTSQQDLNGQGFYERIEERTTVIGTDGSRTTTVLGKADDGTIFSREVTEVSDDGWQTTVSRDLDGDDTFEFVGTRIESWNSAGVRTITETLRSENDTLLQRQVTTISANGRNVTVETDIDGNGVKDLSVTTLRDAAGQVTTTTDRYATGGARETRQVVTVSPDGLTVVDERDITGNNRPEQIVTTQTTLGANGTVTTERLWHTYNYVDLARMVVMVSDDGLRRTIRIDDDGDGIFDFRAEEETILAADGTVTTTRSGFNATSTGIGSMVTTTSGNGLVNATETDYSGDGLADRVREITRQADGAAQEEVWRFGAGSQLLEHVSTETSANGRRIESLMDRMAMAGWTAASCRKSTSAGT